METASEESSRVLFSVLFRESSRQCFSEAFSLELSCDPQESSREHAMQDLRGT